MSLKLGNTSINKLFLGSTEIKKAYLGSTLIFDNTVVVPVLYDDVSVMYTLRRPSMTVFWTNAVAKIRRTSDNQTAFVFIDGSAIDDTISLSSLISTSSNTTPSATTLGTWVGANDAFVKEWIGITPNNTIDSNKIAKQLSSSFQPQLISSGVIITKNSKPTINFLSSTSHLGTNANTDLDSGQSFTILSVVSSNNITNVNAFFNTATATSDRFVLYADRRTQKRIIQLRGSGSNYFADYLTQQNTVNQKLLTAINDGSNIVSYYNSTIQNTTAWGGSYTNNFLGIGSDSSAQNPLNGTGQEIIIFPSDKTADLTDLHNDIDTYYSIP